MLFVAEIGLNYEGDLDLANRLIIQAKMAGADAVKFQFGWRYKQGEINFMTADRAQLLKNSADNAGIQFFASIIQEEGLDWARHIDMQMYKIASRTVVDNPALCEKILRLDKLTFISLGMWEGKGFPFGPPSKKLRYIFCRSKYPTTHEDLKGFPLRFHEHEFYGYSDHCIGLEACFLALSRGAQFIEKHFTWNKASTTIRDHALSATPYEFGQLVGLGRPIADLTKALS